jgi:Tol biopolymer transport system component
MADPRPTILLAAALLLALPAAAHADAPTVAPAAIGADAPPVSQDTLDEAEDENGDGLPLDPARRLQFTATEGSWISVDVSPDGATIVFDLLGDLYTMPVEGGRAERLTDGMGFDSQPRFSPDGERIAFVSDRSGGENVWIVSRDRTDTTQVTKGDQNQLHSPEWTPDGDYLVVSRAQGFGPPYKLHMYHVEGGSGVQLVKEPESLRMSGAAFEPDGRRIWYAARQGLWEYNADLPQYQLQVYDRETGERYTRTSRYGSAFRPTVSPDGRWLVYGTRHDEHTGLRIRDLDTGDERWLAYPVQRDDQESIATMDAYPGMSFTPDSEALIATWDGRIWRVPVNGGEPTEIPFQAEVDLGIGPELDFDYEIPDEPTFEARQVRDAAPSPDGSRLAFTVLDRLYVMGWPDGEPRRLTGTRDVVEAQPTWSPDGRWIAYATWSTLEGEGGHLYRVRADGSGQPRRLTRDPAVYRQPAWSPDSDRIVALRGPARAYRESAGPFAPNAAEDIVWVPADPATDGDGRAGSRARHVAPTEGRRHPHFTRDEPGRIHLTDDDGVLVSLRFDGTDQKEHLKVTGYQAPLSENPMEADHIRMAPEGDRAVAEVGWQLYSVTVPYVGGETPTVSVTDPGSAPVPVVRLTEVGGEFPRWASTGAHVHWSLGAHHFVYDLERAKVVRDSLEAAKEEEDRKEKEEEAKEEEDEGGVEGPPAEADTADREAADEEAADDEEDEGYEPLERKIAVRVERDLPSGTIAFTGARIVTMDGDRVIEDGTLVVRGRRIAAVGPSDRVTVPDDAEVRDVRGKTLLPGFVDTHGHPWPAWGIHRTQVAKYLANLAYGVTTTRDPQTSTTDVLTYADRVEAGEMLGPRVYSTGPGVFSSTAIEDLDHARDVIRKYSEYFDTKTIKQYLAGNREQRQWILMASREQELMPTTEGALDMKLDLTQIIDGYPGHEHSFPIFPLYEDVDRLVAFTRVAYTPTLLVSYGGPWAENYFYSRHNPHDDAKLQRFTPHQELDAKTRRRGAGWFMDEEHVFDDHARELAEMVEAGGLAGVGSHGQLEGLGYHWELWAVASGGLSNHDALRVATMHGARAIGLERELGSLEAGKLADVLVLEGNPLEDLRQTNTLTHVMKNGRLYEADTLDEVWPRQRELGPMYWQGREPGA